MGESNHNEQPSLTLDLMNILPRLSAINNIVPLGVYLRIPLPKLKQIEKEYKDLVRQKIEMINYWLGNSRECSWGRLAEAVESLGDHEQLASELKELENNRLSEAGSKQPDILGIPRYRSIFYTGVPGWWCSMARV